MGQYAKEQRKSIVIFVNGEVTFLEWTKQVSNKITGQCWQHHGEVWCFGNVLLHLNIWYQAIGQYAKEQQKRIVIFVNGGVTFLEWTQQMSNKITGQFWLHHGQVRSYLPAKPEKFIIYVD